MLVCALITSSMAARLKREAEKSEAESGYMQILFGINRNLRKGTTREEILDICGRLVQSLLKRNIVIYDMLDGKMNRMKIYPASEREDASCLTSLFKNPDEMAVAAWVYKTIIRPEPPQIHCREPGPDIRPYIRTIRSMRSLVWR